MRDIRASRGKNRGRLSAIHIFARIPRRRLRNNVSCDTLAPVPSCAHVPVRHTCCHARGDVLHREAKSATRVTEDGLPSCRGPFKRPLTTDRDASGVRARSWLRSKSVRLERRFRHVKNDISPLAFPYLYRRFYIYALKTRARARARVAAGSLLCNVRCHEAGRTC